MTKFSSWAEVLAHVDAGNDRLMYHAPMDPRPVLVWVTRRFKNGKLRLTRAEVTFTADAEHLSRLGKVG